MSGKAIIKNLILFTIIVILLTANARGGENYWRCISQQDDNTVLIETMWADTVIQVGGKPHGLVFQKNRYGTEKHLWIVHRGGKISKCLSAEMDNQDTLDNGSVWVVDLHGFKTLAKIPVGKSPAHIAIITRGKIETLKAGVNNQISNPAYAFVTNELDNDVSVIDIWARKVIERIPVGIRPHMVRISPDQKYVCVANLGSEDISLIDPLKFEVAKTIKVGKTPFGMDFTPDGKYLYISLSEENSLLKLDCKSWEVLDKIPVGSNPLGIRVSLPTGRYVYVACPGVDDNSNSLVFKIDTKTKKTVAKIKVGKGCSELEINTRGDYLSVINTLENTLTEIQMGTSSVVGTRSIGNCPIYIVSDR